MRGPVAGPYLAGLLQGGGKVPQQDVLLATFMDNYWLARTPAGDPFAVAREVPCIAIPLKGKNGLRQRLAADMWELTGKMPSSEAQSTALGTLEGMASQARPAAQALRTARAPDGVICLDLGGPDGTAAWITAGGWGLTTRPPVLFRRSGATLELPVPASGQALSAGLQQVLNIRDHDQFALYTACRLLSVIPEGTRPVELITGQPGAAKTSMTRITVSWLGGGMTQMPRDPRDWAAIASNAHVLGHDNVSSMSADRQDLLCMAASGHEHMARQLYTDADLLTIRFRPLTIVINGIEVGMLRSDLIRRAVCHYLRKPDRYMAEGEVSAAWRAGHPAALGWLLDLLAAVLARMERIPRPSGDSLAEFAHVLAALDSLWGTGALSLWRDGQRSLYADLAESDPVAVAIRKAVKEPWHGTAGDLLAVLDEAYALPPGSGGRPWTPQRLSGAVERAQAALEAFGWKVEHERDPHRKTRTVRLWPAG